MTSALFNRSLGTVSPHSVSAQETARLLRYLHAAPGIRFDGDAASSKPPKLSEHTSTEDQGNGEGIDSFVPSSGGEERSVWAHREGVNCLVVDRFEGRYMLSGGASSTILLWDLEATASEIDIVYRPIGRTDSRNAARTHTYGVTHLSFYPFDSAAFLSSSYDHTLKIYETETMAPSASFDLGSVVYSHALSPVADHVLVACATQHLAVRLVDLRSGASAHSLAGHKGAVLSVAWSPVDDYLLASAGADGTVRLWDIRRSAGCLGVMDLEDSIGLAGEDGLGKNARPRTRGRAHVGACNGVVWTDDGKYLVSAGHDERVRVWDVGLGANALSHFGPVIKNTNLSTLLPLLVPKNIGKSGERIMIYPNEKEILMFDLLEGTLLKRFRSPGSKVAQAGASGGQRNTRNRVMSLAWRAGNVEFYSAHADGLIRAWKPRTPIDADLDKEATLGIEDDEDDDRKRKRQALDDMFRDLTKQKITFS